METIFRISLFIVGGILIYSAISKKFYSISVTIGLISMISFIILYFLINGITKLALNGLTLKLATQFKESKIKVNSVDPGFTATYPGTEEYGARPVEEGAKGIVWAATLPDDGPTGGFFKDGKPINW